MTGRPPLLFVHGALHGPWCWQEHFVPWFTHAGFEAHSVALRGHGARPEPRRTINRHRMRDYVDDVVATVRTLDQPPVVVGHSMGGGVVQQLLARPDGPAVAGAALLAAVSPRGVVGTVARIARRHPERFVAVNVTRDLHRLVATPALAREWFFSPRLPEADVRRHRARLQPESYRAFLDMLVLDRPRAVRTDVPIFVLGAELDTIISVREVEATARAWGTTATILNGIAHDVMLDVGWQQAATALQAWLCGPLRSPAQV